MAEFYIKSLSDLNTVAKEFLGFFFNEKIFAFYGEMGAGKTTFIKALCKQLNARDVISSPSFSLINEYFSPYHGEIYHFDFFRLNKPEEALDIGAEDYLYSGHYCFIEWPEKITGFLPEGTIHVFIQSMDNQVRILRVKEKE